MKQCLGCGREYDNTMSFCLDDGAELLYGPASTDEPATAILPSGTAKTVPKSTGFDKRILAALILLAIIVLGGLFGYRYFSPSKQIESIAVMPFVNESGNADVEYLSDGMTETLSPRCSTG